MLTISHTFGIIDLTKGKVIKTMRKIKANIVEQIICGICAFFLVWFVASWFDVVANNMNGANYQWWNLIVMIFG